MGRKLPPAVEAQRAQLVALYKAAQADINVQLVAAANMPFRAFRLAEQLRQVDAIVAALEASVASAADELVSAYYKGGADLGAVALRVQGVSVGALDMGNQIHTAAVQTIANQMAVELATSAQGIAKSAKNFLHQTQQKAIQEADINRILGRGLIEGEARRTTSKSLAKSITDKLDEGMKVQAGSRHFTPDYYAELVTRTRTREAVTQGAIARGVEYGVTLYQVSRHAGACDLCVPFEGKIYSLVEDPRFPLLDKKPPYHPNCRHVLLCYVPVPGKEDELEALSKASLQDGAIKPGQAGYPESMALDKKIVKEQRKRYLARSERKRRARANTKARLEGKPVPYPPGNRKPYPEA